MLTFLLSLCKWKHFKQLWPTASFDPTLGGDKSAVISQMSFSIRLQSRNGTGWPVPVYSIVGLKTSLVTVLCSWVDLLTFIRLRKSRPKSVGHTPPSHMAISWPFYLESSGTESFFDRDFFFSVATATDRHKPGYQILAYFVGLFTDCSLEKDGMHFG